MRVILIALCLAALIPLQFNAAHAEGALAKPPDAQLTLVSSVDTMTTSGLTESELYRGRYLAYTVDFRDTMGEVLTRHLGNNDLDFLLPDHTFVALDMFETV